MNSANYLSLALIVPAVAACSIWDKESAAQKWMAAQESAMVSPRLLPIPEFIDTPSVNYSAKIHDPFDPARTSARMGTAQEPGKSGVLFPDVPVTSLSIVGFITASTSGRVAVVRSGNVYRSVRQGDRIGEQAASVKQIDGQGLLLETDGMSNQWLLRDK